jgi:hypothetical protein
VTPKSDNSSYAREQYEFTDSDVTRRHARHGTTNGSRADEGILTAVALSDQQLERLAGLIADRLAIRSDGELIDAGQLAQRIGRTREFVYEHAQQLGAISLGDGPRPRLAFRWPQVLDRLDDRPPPSSPTPPPAVRAARSRPTKRAVTDLLPIRGQATHPNRRTA